MSIACFYKLKVFHQLAGACCGLKLHSRAECQIELMSYPELLSGAARPACMSTGEDVQVGSS